MITAGMKLTSLRMVKLAIDKGFALKIIENVFSEGTDEKGDHWTGTRVEIGYENSAYDEYTIVHQYLADGEIFAVPMSEYEEWHELNYPDWDDYDM